MNDQYNLPPQTAQLLTPERIQKCKNLGLFLDKYAPQTAIAPNKSANKSTWLKELHANTHIDKQLAEQVYKRWQRTIETMKASTFTATTSWRMVVGLGGETVLETDLTLHHLYGIPFIPGSALKGLTRAYVTGEVHRSKKIEDDDPIVKRIFGTQDNAGSTIFFDAIPVNGKTTIDLDIMNVHYPKYYSQQEMPTNDQDPNPIPFLTVTGTTFTFALAPRRPSDIKDVEIAMGWLQKALQDYGVGGKTSAGYGYFTILPQQKDTTTPSVAIQIAKPPPYIRPNIPGFVANQGITGLVIAPTDELQKRIPDAQAFLRYREFSTKDVLIVVTAEEARNWETGQTRNCMFLREEERDGCTILICQPGSNKKKKR